LKSISASLACSLLFLGGGQFNEKFEQVSDQEAIQVLEETNAPVKPSL